MLDSHDEVEETEDGQKIRFHYEKKDMGNDQISISVSSDVLDTAEDMAEAMADIPAKVCLCNRREFVIVVYRT